MKLLLAGFALFALFALSAQAETLKPIFDREWKCSNNSETITIGLNFISQKDPDLFSLTILRKGSEPNISKEAECLKSTLLEMKQEGLSPEKLWVIYTTFGGANSKDLAIAADTSKQWEEAQKNDHARMVIQLLNASDIYAPYNDALRPFGLNVQVAAAEYISLSKANTLGLDTVNGHLLPSGASLQLLVKPLH